MERGEKGCNLICDEVAPLSTGKDEEKEGPSLPSFALRLGEMSEKAGFPSFAEKTETASPGAARRQRAAPGDAAPHPAGVRERVGCLAV